MSEVRDASHSPSSTRSLRIPDDSMIIRYDSTDPTDVLDNPRHHFGDELYDRVVPEKLGGILVELLEKYQKLSQVNSNITVMNVKHLLQRDEFKVADIYDLVDKFYVDIPDINSVNSSWISQEHLPLLIEKQNLHIDIKKSLVVLQTTLDNTKDCSQERCCYEDDVDDEVCVSKKEKRLEEAEDDEVCNVTATKTKKKNKKKTT